MENKNFTLLSQDEIDALVSFLSEKDDTVESGVLSQDSIDRLINLLSVADKSIFGKPAKSEHIDAIVDKEVVKGLEMKFTVKEETDRVSVYVVCNGDKLELNPMCLEYRVMVEDDSSWGKAIDPGKFCQLASAFELEYTKETYDKVVSRFAEIMYGDANALIASVYLPNKDNLANIIS